MVRKARSVCVNYGSLFQLACNTFGTVCVSPWNYCNRNAGILQASSPRAVCQHYHAYILAGPLECRGPKAGRLLGPAKPQAVEKHRYFHLRTNGGLFAPEHLDANILIAVQNDSSIEAAIYYLCSISIAIHPIEVEFKDG